MIKQVSIFQFIHDVNQKELKFLYFGPLEMILIYHGMKDVKSFPGYRDLKICLFTII